MYDQVSKQFRKIPIKAAAQRPAFYDNETEKQLAIIEGPAHAALGRLRRGEALSESARAEFALYIAVMLKRVPHGRQRAQQLLPAVFEQSRNRARSQVSAWATKLNTPEEDVARRLDQLDSIYEKFWQDPPQEVVDQINSPWHGPRVVQAIHSMTWRVMRGEPDNPFITGDNPAAYFESEGVGQPESELTFPLSSDLVLLASRRGSPGELISVPTRPSLVREVNRRMAAGTDRFVFCCEDKEWIPSLMEKSRLRVDHIKWQWL